MAPSKPAKLYQENRMFSDFDEYVADAKAWYERRSVWAAGGVGVAVGLVLSYIF